MHFDGPDSNAADLDEEIPGWQFAVGAGILGWILDAFDFFVVVFLISELMERLQVGKAAIVWSMTLTLAMRPFGALLFGSLADRFGRKRPLMTCVLYISTVTMMSGLAPNYEFFLFTRILYGLGMGGYWGIGASYAMECAPRRKRGFLSGMMQGGYPAGYLLASIAIQTVAPAFGWRSLFFIGISFTAVIIVLTLLAPESMPWNANRVFSMKGIGQTLLQHKAVFAYLLVLMICMTCLSHGTQDLYPDFLKTIPWMTGARVLGMNANLGIPVIYNIGAVIGALGVGALSERLGRRYAMIVALGLCLLSMPMWAFGTSVAAIVIGSYVMQTGVQGAFGVIPAHLNELAPDAIRGLFPGLVYQLGVLFASPVLPLQHILQVKFGYPWALCSFETLVIFSLIAIFSFGPERHGRQLIVATSEAQVVES